MNSLTLSFNDVNFSPIERNNQIWLTASELARALGYARSDAVSKIYERNSDEFTSEMTLTVKMGVKGFGNGSSEKDTRIFNSRGCHLITFFARTNVAKQFRKWVLDVLDREILKSQVNSCNKISSEQQAALHEVVDRRSKGERKVYAEMWSRHNRHFKIPRYSELHAVHFEDAKQYLETMQLRQPKLVQDDKTIFSELEQTTTDQVMSYIFSLMSEVNRLNGRMPKPLDFDDELMTRAVVNDRMAGKRMFLTFNARTSQPEVKFIGNDMVVVNKDNIQKVIGDSNQIPTKALPGVIEAVAKRMK
ncbi:BRO family protein [Acinetobacter sp. HY1485]|uniref:BRO family protein n=1 Tax=Acinetobacter sp. HY1485 TaxID=2970918 RepID=UPI0022B9C05C|nr:BRO family protein [Acinetobacter sp. HY1485]